jgi:hypothetical protein
MVIDSYYNGILVSSKQETEISQFTSKETLLKDVIEALGVINAGETNKLTLEICIDTKGRYRLIKKWST